jgi:hypothetical protein
VDGLTWFEFFLTLRQAFNVQPVFVSGVPTLRRTLSDGSIKEMVLPSVDPSHANRMVPATRFRNVLDRLGITDEEFENA